MNTMLDFLPSTFLENSLLSWFWALSLSTIVFLSVLALRQQLHRRILANIDFTDESSSLLYKIVFTLLEKISFLILIALAIVAGSFALDLGENHTVFGKKLLTVVVLIQVGIWISAVYSVIANYSLRFSSESSRKSAFGLISFAGKTIIWSLIFILALDNLGVNISALIAGLGIGGIAVALAMQNILSDLFSSLSIILDKPFEVGDFVVVDDIRGSVESIGIKTTRLRSISGEQIVLSNSDLLNSRVRNFKRMYERRVVFNFGVVYDTPPEQLEFIPTIVKEILAVEELARLDRVHLISFGEFALNYEVVFFVNSSEYNVYMDIQQRLNLALIRQFKARKIDFAFPTQTLHIASAPNK